MSREENRRVSRRKLVHTAAVSAGAATVAGAAGVAFAPATGAQGSGDPFLNGPGKVSVAGVVVRADHAPAAAGQLAIGVRASIWHPALEATGVVLVVEPVAFGQAEEVNTQVANGLRQQVSRLLGERGYPTDPEEIAVNLFGGVF